MYFNQSVPTRTSSNWLCCPARKWSHSFATNWSSTWRSYFPHLGASYAAWRLSASHGLVLWLFMGYNVLKQFQTIYLSIDPSIYRSIHLSIYLSIHPSIYLSFFLSIYLGSCVVCKDIDNIGIDISIDIDVETVMAVMRPFLKFSCFKQLRPPLRGSVSYPSGAPEAHVGRP